MKIKNILLLPFIAILGACSILDTSDTPDANKGEVDALAMEQANFKWDGSDRKIHADAMPKEELQKVVATLIANEGKLVVYFDYDVAEINPEINQEIIKHIDFMQANPKIRLRLEGHADERGTREYNLALGENRALGVKQALGIALEDRIEVISYGEEKPVSDDYAKNRRVEFIYQ